MRYLMIGLMGLVCVIGVFAEERNEGPASEKAQKTFKRAMEYLRDRMPDAALEEFAKADKQDGGRCVACQKQLIKYGVDLQRWDFAEAAAGEMVDQADTPMASALAHYELGLILVQEANAKNKQELSERAHDEFSKSLQAYSNFPTAIFVDGMTLARLKRDDEAKTRFEQYVKMRPADDPNRRRAILYIGQPDLARARMAPAFAFTTPEGQRISLDDLKGKVVLIDFWATWCAPCREALPRLQKIAKNFQGQPLAILSISLDDNEQKWKDFVDKNQMTWPQYRDGGFKGPISQLFDVRAIPHTFTIDADGVLQDEHIGDASIEGKLKKLVTHARELQLAEKPAQEISVQPDKKN